MKTSTTTHMSPAGLARPGKRRVLAGALALCAFCGAAVAALTGPSATAAPDPCQASEVAKTIGKVAADTGVYLEKHPQANIALTNASKQEAPVAIASLKTYFDNNPLVAEDLKDIQTPLTSLGGKCDLPISLPQVMTLMQAASQAQATGTVPGAQEVADAVPGVQVPAAEVPAGTGQQPAPAATVADASSGT